MMVFPFYGIDKKGWFIKPRGKHIAWGLGSARLGDVKKVLRSLCCDSTNSDLVNMLSRFSSLEQMYTSYQYGHFLWEGAIGKTMEKEFGFDPATYKSRNFPNHVTFVDTGAKVNKWLHA